MRIRALLTGGTPGRYVDIGVLALLSALATLTGPLIVRYGVNRISSADPDLDRTLLWCSVLFVVAALLAIGLASLLTRRAGDLGERAVERLRSEGFRRVVLRDQEWLDRHAGSSLVTRLTADVDLIEDFLQQGLVSLLQTVSTLVVLVTILLVLSWPLAIASLVPVLLLVRSTTAFRRRVEPAYLQLRERAGTTLSALEEALAGIRVVRAYARSSDMAQRLDALNSEQHRAELVTVRHQARFLPVVELATAASTAVALALGGWMVVQGHTDLGTLTAFLLYLLILADPVQTLGYLMTTMQNAVAAHRRLASLVEQAGAAEQQEGRALPARAALTLADVTFGYRPEDPVLRGVSLRIEHGDRIFLVGPSGGGKSTLAALLAGIRRPTQGRACYGEVDLVEAADVRSRIAVVDQVSYLFSGTLLDNIAYVAPDLGEDRIARLVHEMGVADVIAGIPGGLRAEVGPGGESLSLGQRQVIGLVRAALLDVDVIVMDEVTAQVDPATERALTTAMEVLFDGRTVVMIAHRLSSIRAGDRVAVIEDGGIAELGTQEHLLATGGRFARLRAEWMSG
jgi:ATP-binding cassette, subfamily B, bacterial